MPTNPPSYIQPQYYSPSRHSYQQGHFQRDGEYASEIHHLQAHLAPENDGGYWQSTRDDAVRLLSDSGAPYVYSVPISAVSFTCTWTNTVHICITPRSHDTPATERHYLHIRRTHSRSRSSNASLRQQHILRLHLLNHFSLRLLLQGLSLNDLLGRARLFIIPKSPHIPSRVLSPNIRARSAPT